MASPLAASMCACVYQRPEQLIVETLLVPDLGPQDVPSGSPESPEE